MEYATILITGLIALSFVVEYLTGIAKDVYETIKNKDYWSLVVKLTALIIGVLIAFVVNSEVLPLLNLGQFTAPLVVVAGLVISAGSTKVYDLFDRIKNGTNRE